MKTKTVGAINFGKFAEDQIDIVTSNMEEDLQILKKDTDKNTPEDTRRLIGNNKIEHPKRVGGKIIGRLYNETHYAYWVEIGVGLKQYNYHKPKGKVFYRGVGARMFTKAYEKNKKNFLYKLAKKL